MIKRTISTEVAIEDLINTSLADVQAKKSSQLSIDGLNIDDEIQEDWMNDPRYAKAEEATTMGYEKTIQQSNNRCLNSDGLPPIVVLLGEASMIRRKVIEPFESRILYDSHYGWDIEFKEINSYQLTKEFVNNFPTPTGKDGGVLFVANVTRFSEMYDVNGQSQIVRAIMVNQKRVESTGWRIVFIEDTSDRGISFPQSFVYNWTKDNLNIWFVEE